MLELVAGSNLILQDVFNLQLRLVTHPKNPMAQPDFAAYLLHESTAKVRGDADMVFYGQKQTPNASVKIIQQTRPYCFAFELNRIDQDVGKIAICMSLDAPHNFSDIEDLNIELIQQNKTLATAKILGNGRSEAALIVGEFYRRQGQWKFRLVAQGFNGGLKPLSEHFGVEIKEEVTPSPTPQPPKPQQKSALNLSKITLDKRNSQIKLSKTTQGFGEIKVNLNWNQQALQPSSKNFFGKIFSSSSGIDLDLGCFCELRNGKKFVIQALGNTFGHLHQAPYILLSGDDRTGQSQEGEWLTINGQHWSEIQRIVIFAYIYSGVARWAATDAKVNILVPNQAPIEIHLDEAKNLNMCGIVELTNQEGSLQVQRHVHYVAGHVELDRAFGFGLRWKEGHK